jgi:hypothetical protein
VKHYAQAIALRPGFSDVMDGTEHVYFTLSARDEYHARAIVENAIGKSFCRVEEL